MPDAKFKTFAVALGWLAAVLSGSTTDAALAAPSLAALNASTPHHSQVIKVGDRWYGPGWGPAPYPVGCAAGPCGPAAAWHASGWGPAPYPAGCAAGPCAPAAAWRTAGWGPAPCSPCAAAGWHNSGWGPAPYPVGCAAGPCGPAAAWHSSGWGPAPYPAGCGAAPCAGPGWQTSSWDAGWQTTSWSWQGPAW